MTTKQIKEKRSTQQNRALHLFFTKLAKALNNAGLDMKAVLKPEIDIPWDGRSVKDYLWKPIQELVLHKKSTTKLLRRKDIDKVFDTLNRHLGEKFGVHIPFPSEEELALIKMSKENK